MRILVDVDQLSGTEKGCSLFWFLVEDSEPSTISQLIWKILTSIDCINHFSENEYLILLNGNILPYWTRTAILRDQDLIKFTRQNFPNPTTINKFLSRESLVQPPQTTEKFPSINEQKDNSPTCEQWLANGVNPIQPPQTTKKGPSTKAQTDNSSSSAQWVANEVNSVQPPQTTKKGPPIKAQTDNSSNSKHWAATAVNSVQSSSFRPSAKPQKRPSKINQSLTLPQKSVYPSQPVSSSSSSSTPPPTCLPTTKPPPKSNRKHIIFHSDEEPAHTSSPLIDIPMTHIDVNQITRQPTTTKPSTIIDLGDLPSAPVFSRAAPPVCHNESDFLIGTGPPSTPPCTTASISNGLTSLPHVGNILQFCVANVDDNFIPYVSSPMVGVVVAVDQEEQSIDFGMGEASDVVCS